MSSRQAMLDRKENKYARKAAIYNAIPYIDSSIQTDIILKTVAIPGYLLRNGKLVPNRKRQIRKINLMAHKSIVKNARLSIFRR